MPKVTYNQIAEVVYKVKIKEPNTEILSQMMQIKHNIKCKILNIHLKPIV